MENVLDDIKDILVHFDYPGLNDIIADEEFIEIMKASNRKDLLSWILKTLDDCYVDVLEVNKETFLVEHMYELGFCCQRESQHFVKGELDPLREIEIIHSLLKYLRRVKMSNTIENISISMQSSVDVLERKDINLFPMFGNIKLSNVNDKYNEGVNESTTLTQLSPEKHSEDIADSLEKISSFLPKLEKISKSMDVNNSVPPKMFNLDCGILYKCNENIKIIKQYTEDVGTLIEFLSCEQTQIDNQETKAETKTLFETLLSLISDFVNES